MHKCEVQACPLQCQLCKRTCIAEDHLHGLDSQAAHLCGSVLPQTLYQAYHSISEQHMCTALCQAHGICQIETTPHSMDATFTGKYGAFQYTKVCALSLKFRLDNSDFASSIRSVRQVLFVGTCLPSDLLWIAAKRLPCVLAIPSGQLAHGGAHHHSADTNAPHFCETRYVGWCMTRVVFLMIITGARIVDITVFCLSV
jgi:hypothetical protein